MITTVMLFVRVLSFYYFLLALLSVKFYYLYY